MRFQIVHAWPVGQYVIPAMSIIDRASSDMWSQIGVQHIPPPDAVPLDAGATALLAAVYTPTGYVKEQNPTTEHRKLLSKTMVQLDAQIQDEITASADRYYWLIRLQRGAHVPTRKLMNVALAAIADFHDASVNENNSPTDVGRFVAAAEAWLVRVQGRIWKIAAEEEA
jgi:hypothetical protein